MRDELAGRIEDFLQNRASSADLWYWCLEHVEALAALIGVDPVTLELYGSVIDLLLAYHEHNIDEATLRIELAAELEAAHLAHAGLAGRSTTA